MTYYAEIILMKANKCCRCSPMDSGGFYRQKNELTLPCHPARNVV